MARTASSLASPSVTSAISLHIARLTALRIFGRLNTTVAMPPSRSTRISSLMPFPLCAPPGCLPRAGQSIGSVGELQLSLRKAFGAGCIFWDTPGTNMASGSPARFRGVRLGLALALLAAALAPVSRRSEEHTSELQSQFHLVCRLLLDKKKQQQTGLETRLKKNMTTT